MSDDDENDGRGLADQLEDLEIETVDRDEQSPDADADEQAEETADSPPDPEERFEEALEDLDDGDPLEMKYQEGELEDEDQVSSESDPADESNDAAGDADRARGPLADQLDAVEAEELPDHASDETGTRGEAEPAEGPESLEEALDGLDPSEMRNRKYDDAGGGSPDSEEDAEATGRREGRASGAEDEPHEAGVGDDAVRKFERAMSDVEPMEGSSKYATTDEPDPDAYLEETSARTPEDFATPTLPKSGAGLNDIPKLDDRQEAMLERCEEWQRRHDVPELNLRGERVDSATDRLRDFMRQARASGDRFVRIVPGKGRRSDGPPALKPAVLEWLEGPGAEWIRGYAPEREFGGDYGSIVVEFRRET